MAWADTWGNTNNSGALAWAGICCSGDGVNVAAIIGQAGQSGYIYISSTTGATWTAKASSVQRFDIACADDFSVIIATPVSGYLERSLDNGTSWHTVDSSRAWRGICCTPDGAIWYAGVSSGKIYKSTDYGANWSALANSLTKDWYKIDCSSDGSRIVATVNGGGQNVYMSTDSGASWATTGSMTNCRAVSMSNDGQHSYTAISSGFIYVTNDGGANWYSRNISVSGTASACSSDGRFVLIGDSGGSSISLRASTDYGASFYPVTVTSVSASGVCLSTDGTVAHLALFARYVYTSYTNSLTIESVVPDFGPIVGGQSVTINGFGFVSGATVKFDTSSATSVNVVSSQQITCVTPAHVAGPVDVTVTNP